MTVYKKKKTAVVFVWQISLLMFHHRNFIVGLLKVNLYVHDTINNI